MNTGRKIEVRVAGATEVEPEGGDVSMRRRTGREDRPQVSRRPRWNPRLDGSGGDSGTGSRPWTDGDDATLLRESGRALGSPGPDESTGRGAGLPLSSGALEVEDQFQVRRPEHRGGSPLASTMDQSSSWINPKLSGSRTGQQKPSQSDRTRSRWKPDLATDQAPAYEASFCWRPVRTPGHSSRRMLKYTQSSSRPSGVIW